MAGNDTMQLPLKQMPKGRHPASEEETLGAEGMPQKPEHKAPLPKADPADESATKPAAEADRLFPSRLLGFGVFLAWSSLSISLEVKLGVAELSSPIARFFLISGLCAGLYLLIAGIVHRTGSMPLKRRVLPVCALSGTLVSPLEFAASVTRILAFDVAAIVCLSVATVGLFLLWNVQIALREPKTALIAYSGSFCLAAGVFFLAESFDGVIFVATLMLMPPLSGLLLHLSGQLDKATETDVEQGAKWRIPWRPIVLILVFTCAFGTVSHFDGNALLPTELGRLLAGLCVLVITIAMFSRLDENLIAKISGIIAASALLICSVQGPDSGFGASKLLASMGYYGFMLFALFTISRICYSYKVHAEWLFSIVQIAYILASAPSGFLGNILQEASLSGNAMVASAAMAALALALLTACLFLLAENPFARTWGLNAIRQVSTASGERSDKGAARDYLADRMYRCAMIARNYGLTHREEEILALLADGKSFADIEAMLVIAHGTLRAHVQHLYKKLDVHSFAEAVDFVNEWSG